MVQTAMPTYESLEVGAAAPELEFGPVTLNMILRYAGASGDFNPLHNDPDFARAAGYPGIFAMGMMPAAWLGRMLTDWVGPQSIRRYKVRFVNLQFTDLMGIVKSVAIPIHQFEDACINGKWFDGSSIEGFARIAESDMFLVPDLSTWAVMPWERAEESTARAIC